MDNEMMDSILDMQCGEAGCTPDEIISRIAKCKDELNTFIWCGASDAGKILSVARELELCGRLLEIHLRTHREENAD